MVGLGHLAGDLHSGASDCSADGSVLVGSSGTYVPDPKEAYAAGSDCHEQAFRWTASEGMSALGWLSSRDDQIYAGGTSGDGSVVVGHSGLRAFRWTQDSGMIGLGMLPGDHYSYAIAVSADGVVIVGTSHRRVSSEPYHVQSTAFVWTAEEDMASLGRLPGTDYSKATAVSADASVVVGCSGHQAFRWTVAGGMVGLGDLAGGGFYSHARDVSADGSLVVGQSESVLGSEAFVWEQTQGMRSLKHVLEHDCGLDLTGWQLSNASGVSADGRVIVGAGTGPDGQFQAWVATLPEPSAFALLAVSLAASLMHVRRRPTR